MKILILGDTHGHWPETNYVISHAIAKHPDITHVIQVGDFGYGWKGSKPFTFVKTHFPDGKPDIPFYFIDGNHENHNILDFDGGAWQPDWQYMSRGSVLEIEGKRLMFMGGASSVDQQWRTPHLSWWPQESISSKNIEDGIANIGDSIDAVFSHEHPASFTYSDERYTDINSIYTEIAEKVCKQDKELLDNLLSHTKPKFWFFGHHHIYDKGQHKNTQWACAPIIDSLEYILWDGKTFSLT